MSTFQRGLLQALKQALRKGLAQLVGLHQRKDLALLLLRLWWWRWALLRMGLAHCHQTAVMQQAPLLNRRDLLLPEFRKETCLHPQEHRTERAEQALKACLVFQTLELPQSSPGELLVVPQALLLGLQRRETALKALQTTVEPERMHQRKTWTRERRAQARSHQK